MEIDLSAFRETFFQDAEDHLEAMEDALSRLEFDLSDEEALGALFCSVHSLKGDSGALGFESIGKLLHGFETILDRLRDGNGTLTSELVDKMAGVVDRVDELIESAKDEDHEPEDVEDLLEEIAGLETELERGSSTTQQPSSVTDFGLFDESESVESEEDGSDPAVAEQTNVLGEDHVVSCCPPFIGDFLVGREVLTHQQLIAALDHQQARQPLLGAVMLKSDRMTVKQVARTLGYLDCSGLRFGETAVQMGFITDDELAQALQEQRESRPSLSRVIVELGFVDKCTLWDHYKVFGEQNRSAGVEIEEDNYFDEPPECEQENDADPASNELDADPELMAEFVSESKEHIEEAEEQLLTIETDPKNSESLNAIYRSFHTIKGVASFLGLEDTRNLAHQAESMLNLARDQKLELIGDAFEVALASVDGLKRQIEFAESWLTTQTLQSDPDLPSLLAAIDAVANGNTPANIPSRQEENVRPPSPEVAETPSASKADSPAAARPSIQIKESIKVDRDRLDKLINVIGEMVIGHAMVEEEFAAWQAELGHESLAMSQLNKTVRDLQELSLSLRMVPIGSVFHKMARIVRDLGRKLEKDIQFSTEGDETELDKTVVDQIGDPLMHMVRNAADHGIESPAERVAAGKPPQGKISLRAYHQGGNIYIEIEDDGKGLDRDVLRRKAIEKGVIAESDVLTDHEIDNLIFAPGFSTAKQVTDVSGRGVGMDVVRRNVESLQGSVSVRSQKGVGSTVVIRLPLTLAILDGLSIRVGNEVYILPILSVVESFSPRAEDVKTVVGKGEVVLVRGEVVPLLRIAHLFQVPQNHLSVDEEQSLVVIVEDRGKKFALLVHELLGQSQVVIKNLEANYRKVDGIAGATIMGDGRIAMILDVFGLVSIASRSNHRSEELPGPKGNLDSEHGNEASETANLSQGL